MAERRGSLLLEDQLCFALYAATNAVVRTYRPLLAEHGLTYPQYLVMLVLWQDGASKLRCVADRLSLAPSAVSPLIDRLESAGFVRRVATEDRRVTMIHLTDDGAALKTAIADVQEEVVCRTGLSDEALQALRDDLHSYVEGAMPPPELKETA